MIGRGREVRWEGGECTNFSPQKRDVDGFGRRVDTGYVGLI